MTLTQDFKTQYTPLRGRLRVILDRVEPTAGPAMSAMPGKRRTTADMRSDAMGQRRTLALLNPLGSIPFAAWQLLTALPGQLSQARGCRYAAPSTKKIEDRKPRGTTTMNFGQAISSGFNNYVNFSGRACRSAFWYWALFAVLVAIVTQIADSIIGVPATNILAGLGLLLPGIAVSVRRLHDIDRTGWWLLLGFTIIGVIVLIYWDCVKGTGGPNRYGPDPLAL